ncbi:SDR family oxidoreductase [Okeania sp. KiyG1]|uniref:SDR family oxidoreductase n=1 Tax=Okeania sp. KiyG1 TaxID=2720165 RepID=UPI001921FB4A|nr:SDR family oxidoreductase [Okeania sp. KiyG1]GGA09384.1 short chain dehydrogenase [Okeania sp. KiyG1]
MSFSKEFDGKVALVTGGSSGIGKAAALAFAQAGAKVVIASRGVEEGEQAVHEICARGSDAIFVKTDVSQANEVEALVNKTVDTYGRLDCAFNNAGVGVLRPLINYSEDDWDYVMNINLKGVWLCMKYQIKQMLRQDSGAIVNNSSLAGVVGMANISVYTASKGGVIAMTKATAIEYAKSGIRINVISPGFIETPIFEKVPTERVDQFLEGLSLPPMGRFADSDEVSGAVLFLSLGRSSFITGQNLIIDGGYTAQ